MIAATRNSIDDTRTNRTTITIKQDWRKNNSMGGLRD